MGHWGPGSAGGASSDLAPGRSLGWICSCLQDHFQRSAATPKGKAASWAVAKLCSEVWGAGPTCGVLVRRLASFPKAEACGGPLPCARTRLRSLFGTGGARHSRSAVSRQALWCGPLVRRELSLASSAGEEPNGAAPAGLQSQCAGQVEAGRWWGEFGDLSAACLLPSLRPQSSPWSTWTWACNVSGPGPGRPTRQGGFAPEQGNKGSPTQGGLWVCPLAESKDAACTTTAQPNW